MKLLKLKDYQLQVGKGWSDLVEKAYNKIKDNEFVISQIKEKWGGLRIYLWGTDDETRDFLDVIESESFEICEFCGKIGEPRYSRYWIKTLCDECEKKDMK